MTQAEMEQNIKAAEQEIKDLENSVFDTTAKCVQLEKKVAERWADDERKHKDEIGALRQHNQSLKDELEKHLSMSK